MVDDYMDSFQHEKTDFESSYKCKFCLDYGIQRSNQMQLLLKNLEALLTSLKLLKLLQAY